MRSYRKLLEIELCHNYYPSGKLATSDFNIVATRETNRIIANYRLILKQFENKIEIIQECDRKEKSIEALVEIDGELIFEFIVGQSNKNFFNFTDIRFPVMRKEIFFLSNKKKNKVLESGILTRDKSVSESDIVDISELGLAKEQSASGIIGLIRLYTNKFVNKPIQTKEPLKYTVNFEERKIYWQYNVIEKYNSIKNVSIIDEENKIKFKEVKDNDSEAKIFLSEKKLPMKKVNKQKIKLISTNGKKNFTKTLYEKLPYPTMRDITIHEKLKNEYIAVVTVYV